MKNAKIIVCCHKKDVMATQSPYFPVQVGAALSATNLGIQSDDEGESISLKNRHYCELTGMYWAWKNLKGVDVIGLCHYRRYFDFHHQVIPYMPHTAYNTKEFESVNLSIPNDVIENLSFGKIYLAKPRVYNCSLFTDYCVEHISDDIRALEQYFFEQLDKVFQDAYFRVMHRNNKLSHYNMFLMTWGDFDAYCSWLFPILEEMEKHINVTSYSQTQGRIFGYMAERLLNIWVEAKKMKVLYLPIIWFSDYESNQKSPTRIRFTLRQMKANLAVRLSAPPNLTKWLKNKPYVNNMNDDTIN